jgi:hypothetical protein
VHCRIRHKRHREQRLASVEPEVAHDHDRCVVVHVEEGEPPSGITEDYQKGVYEFEDLGEVEDVGPEKEGPSGRNVRWEAKDPVEVRSVGEDGEGAADGHDKGEEEEGEVVDSGDGFEEVGAKGGERDEVAR